ncbi:MAG TPA: superoxide dismutase [Usitatibacter sp.]|nr:superoxide dismutase [Usitatibacter sp.]
MPGPFQLPALPWEESALAPTISAKTLSLHYGKHHLAYVKKLNELVAGTPYAEQSLEQIVASTKGNAEAKKIYNNAAQAWNHNFYWNCLKPRGGGEPRGGIAKGLESLGGYDAFAKKFAQTAVDTFGSGWAWLVSRDGKLEILSTSNADNPLTLGATPLLTIDVWEHAYYVDYENRRPEHVEAVIKSLLNWNWAEEMLEKGPAQRKAA